MGTVELRNGDIFDGPCDMIVLPCSTAGTITPFVREKLTNFQIIARPKRGMSLGDIEVHPFTGGENIAQFVAYAASVEGSSSSLEAIYQIGCLLGKQTKDGIISRISCPLLGAGAGGLSSDRVADKLRTGFLGYCHSEASLIINVLNEESYRQIRRNLLREPEDHSHGADNSKSTDKPPRIFVSYSHTSPPHKQWVTDLCKFLRSNGIDARLDTWHLRPGMDLPQFMTNELTLADRVILISDEKYTEKADGRIGGVGWETMLVQGDMSNLPPNNNKYIVIVRSSEIDKGLPIYLKTKFVIHWHQDVGDNDNQDKLIREIFDAIQVPPIGKRPTFL